MRNETNETRTTFRVPESNLETLKFRIAKLAKRAAKLNVAPPTVVVGACDSSRTKPTES